MEHDQAIHLLEAEVKFLANAMGTILGMLTSTGTLPMKEYDRLLVLVSGSIDPIAAPMLDMVKVSASRILAARSE